MESMSKYPVRNPARRRLVDVPFAFTRSLFSLLTGVALMAGLPAALGAAKTQPSLVVPAETVRPGDTVIVGLQLRMPPGWHTYWRNPGAAGGATKIQWTLPQGVTAGEIQWPLPEK